MSGAGITRTLGTVCALVALSWIAPGAFGQDFVDTVDVEVGQKDTITGTLRPIDERESFLLDLPRGASIKATGKKKGNGPAPSLDLVGPDEQVHMTAQPGRRSTKLSSGSLTLSGAHYVRAFTDGDLDGDYTLKFKVKLPKTARESSTTDADVDEVVSVTFGAIEGARVDLTIGGQRRSAFAAEIVDVAGPAAFLETPAGTARRNGSIRASFLAPATGDYVLRFKNVGTAAGAWSVTVKYTNPSATKRKLVITDAVLGGAFAGELDVLGRAIDEDGGLIVASDADGDLDGVAVDVPADAIDQGVVITVGESEEFFSDDDEFGAGLTVELGPSGIEFAEPITITVPYDPQAFEDASAEAIIVTQDEDGNTVALAGPFDVDVDAQTVTGQTAHFSRFQVMSPRPRPLRGTFVEIELSAGITDGLSGGLGMAVNELRGFAGPRSGNNVTRQLNRNFLNFDTNAGVTTLSVSGDSSLQTGVVTQATADDVTMDLGGPDLVFERGRRRGALLRVRQADSPFAFSVLMHSAPGKPTRGALAGSWHAFLYEFNSQRGTAGGVAVGVAVEEFSIHVALDGTAVPTKTRRAANRANLPAGPWVRSTTKRKLKSGRLSPSGRDAVLDFGAEFASISGDSSITLAPVLRGDILIGLVTEIEGPTQAPTSTLQRLIILVRHDRDANRDSFTGRSVFGAFGIVPGFTGPSTPIAEGSIPVLVRRFTIDHDGPALRYRGPSSLLFHDTAGLAQIQRMAVDDSAKFSVRPDGSFKHSGPLASGAIAPRGGVYVAIRASEDDVSLGLGVVTRPDVQ